MATRRGRRHHGRQTWEAKGFVTGLIPMAYAAKDGRHGWHGWQVYCPNRSWWPEYRDRALCGPGGGHNKDGVCPAYEDEGAAWEDVRDKLAANPATFDEWGFRLLKTEPELVARWTEIADDPAAPEKWAAMVRLAREYLRHGVATPPLVLFADRMKDRIDRVPAGMTDSLRVHRELDAQESAEVANREVVE